MLGNSCTFLPFLIPVLLDSSAKQFIHQPFSSSNIRNCSFKVDMANWLILKLAHFETF